MRIAERCFTAALDTTDDFSRRTNIMGLLNARGHFNIFGHGKKLRWAITFACQLAFILFGYDQGGRSPINYLHTHRVLISSIQWYYWKRGFP